TAVFLAHLYGVDLGLGVVVTIVLTASVAASAGAGGPGMSLVTALIVLNALGFGPNAAAGIALVAGIDRPLDMCRTAVNTFGNLVGPAIVARTEGERLRSGLNGWPHYQGEDPVQPVRTSGARRRHCDLFRGSRARHGRLWTHGDRLLHAHGRHGAVRSVARLLLA